MVLETITEIDDGSAASTEDLVEWADRFGLTMPVLSDPNSELMWKFAAGESGSVGLPFTVVMDHGVVIESIASGSQMSAVSDLL
jgi:peroxiredoxin